MEEKSVYTIGELSKITSLSIKSLRLYHDKNILLPSSVDPFTSYRYYDDQAVEKANAIAILKKIGFPLLVIKEILEGYEKGDDIIDYLKDQQGKIKSKIEEYKQISSSINHIIQMEEAMIPEANHDFEIEEKQIETILIAGYKMRGAYDVVGKGFRAISKEFGRHIVGKPMTLYYDGEYHEKDARFEACFPIRKGSSTKDISVRRLPGKKAVTLIHKGPFDQIGRSYQKIFSYINLKSHQTMLPFREKYIKSPGMIFKGNPNNYLTEIIISIKQ